MISDIFLCVKSFSNLDFFKVGVIVFKILLLTLGLYHFRTTHEFLFGALAELVDNARYVVFL